MAERWRRRPVLAVALRLAIFIVPVGGAIAAARGVIKAVPAVGGPGQVGRLLLALLISLLVVDLLERVMKRFLPLAGLLKLSLGFPDRAPSRLKVARTASTIKDLDARLAVARAHGIADEPVKAAEEILALVSALSSHDRRTRGHSERVRVFTDLLSAEVGLGKVDRDRLRWAALLHDIGKLRVDPALLNKSGKPDDDEWEELRSHPVAGAAIVAPLASWLGDWSSAVEHHHERFDGFGYPDGLAGDAIPYAGRLVSVTDAFETMTAARAYKRPMSAAAARSELVRDAGKHFDPAMVRSFLGISMWRLRWAMGPISWLAQLPLIGEIPKIGPAVAKIGDAAVLGAKVVAAGATLAASGLAIGPASAKHDQAPGDRIGVEQVEGPGARRDGNADRQRPSPADLPSEPGSPDEKESPDDPQPSLPSPFDPVLKLPPTTSPPAPPDPVLDPVLDPVTEPVLSDPALPKAPHLPAAPGPMPTNPVPTNPLPNEPLPQGQVPPAVDQVQKGLLKQDDGPATGQLGGLSKL